MTDYFDPYNADRPLMLKCSCGKDHTVAEHQQETSAQGATLELKRRSLTSEFESYSNAFIEASLIKAIFPQDEVRRRFLRAVHARLAPKARRTDAADCAGGSAGHRGCAGVGVLCAKAGLSQANLS